MGTRAVSDRPPSVVIAGAFRVGGGPNRLLRAVLAALALAVTMAALRDLLTQYAPYVDIEIPLRAADRWVHGGAPYLASAFAEPAGYDLPFLYPPPVLPLVAPLLLLPREVVWATWSGVALAAGVYACRRLGIPGRLIPLTLCWPPFAEGILGGNVQVFLFAAFVAVFWRREPGGRSTARDPACRDAPAAADGVLAGLAPAFKLSLPHGWLALLRRRPGAALAGLGLLGAVAALSAAITGPDLWRDWLAQLGRAADPAWPLAGASLAGRLPAAAQLVIAGLTALAVFAAPVSHLGLWTGLLMVIGAPSLRMFGVLFAVPALLAVRREVTLAAAALVATYTYVGLWAGIAIVAATCLLAGRYPALLEPDSASRVAAAA